MFCKHEHSSYMEREMTTMKSEGPVLVLGGTGKTGRRVVERLRVAGVPVRVGSRADDPPFSWDDRTTWAPVLSGASAVYVAYAPDLAVPGAADTVGALAREAVAGGVRRVVLLSGRGEAGALRGEEAVKASGAEWTILRASWFAQNFSENFLLDSVLAGTVALPVGAVREPFVDADDIADVAVAVLTDDRHAGECYELTGPRALTFTEAVAEIAGASRRPVRYVQITPEEFAAGLAAQQVPEDATALLMELFTEILDGRNSETADGVHRALGHAPRDFSEYARRAAATGIWG